MKAFFKINRDRWYHIKNQNLNEEMAEKRSKDLKKRSCHIPFFCK